VIGNNIERIDVVWVHGKLELLATAIPEVCNIRKLLLPSTR